MPPVTGPIKVPRAPSHGEGGLPWISASRAALWSLGLGAIGVSLVVVAASRLTAHDPTDRTSTRSSAYDFGYASAAITACPGIDPDLQNVLATAAPRDPSGRISDDIAQGFRAFSHALDALGAAGACSAASSLVQARQ